MNRHRGIQPSEIKKMPYYAFQLYIKDVDEELQMKKKQHEEQIRQQNRANRSKPAPRSKPPRRGGR